MGATLLSPSELHLISTWDRSAKAVGSTRIEILGDISLFTGGNVDGESEVIGRGLMEGVIEALSDKHGQVDLRLEDLTLAFGDRRLALHLSGNVTVAVHMRDLTDDEKAAHSQATVARLKR